MAVRSGSVHQTAQSLEADAATVQAVEPLKIVESGADLYSLIMSTGETMADPAVVAAGHEPNGYFWQGVAEMLMQPGETTSYDFDCEAGMFCAYGSNLGALQSLGVRMAAVANDPDGMTALIGRAEAQGFEFDD
jgi:hypothetical protein